MSPVLWTSVGALPEITMQRILSITGAVIAALVLLVAGGWIQHLYTCFSQEKWGFLIAGAIFVPVGVIHGWGVWLGLW